MSRIEWLFPWLQVRNGAGLLTVRSSSGYTLDSTAPDVGVVLDGAAGMGDTDYWSDDAVLEAHWLGFSEPHTAIVEYWWAIGTCATCSDVQPFVSVGLHQGMHVMHAACY